MQTKKKKWVNNKVQRINSNFDEENIKRYYKNLKYEVTGYRPKMTNCENRDGVILHDQNDIVDRWREYFQDLLNEEIPEADIEDIRLVDTGTVKKKLGTADHKESNYSC